MSFERWPAHIALAAALLAALSLGACGRKGGLDLPPGATLADTPAAAAPPATGSGGSILPGTLAPAPQDGFDSRGNPIAGQARRKGFFLDPLLD